MKKLGLLRGGSGSPHVCGSVETPAQALCECVGGYEQYRAMSCIDEMFGHYDHSSIDPERCKRRDN
jgi:hypothetical protein